MTFRDGIRASFIIGNAQSNPNFRCGDYVYHILVKNLRRYVYNGVICGVLMVSVIATVCEYFFRDCFILAFVSRVIRFVIRTYS